MLPALLMLIGIITQTAMAPRYLHTGLMLRLQFLPYNRMPGGRPGKFARVYLYHYSHKPTGFLQADGQWANLSNGK